MLRNHIEIDLEVCTVGDAVISWKKILDKSERVSYCRIMFSESSKNIFVSHSSV
jgi:hypothetical protein